MVNINFYSPREREDISERLRLMGLASEAREKRAELAIALTDLVHGFANALDAGLARADALDLLNGLHDAMVNADHKHARIIDECGEPADVFDTSDLDDLIERVRRP